MIAAVWLCAVVLVPARAATTEEWPARVGARTRYSCAQGFVYAQKKAAFEETRKVLTTVIADLQSDGITAGLPGLVLIMDDGEKYPCDADQLTETLKAADPNQEIVKFVEGTRTQGQSLGLDAAAALSLTPAAVPISALHDLIAEFPAGAGGVEWCMIVPTDRCTRTGFLKMMDAALKQRKPSLAERVAFAAAKPLIERQMMAMMRKVRQASLYACVLQTQKGLSPEQKKAKAQAYADKLGLQRRPDAPKSDPNAK